MPDLVVIVPSRNRPQAAHELAEAFVETCTADTRLVFTLDERDVAQIYDYPFFSSGTVDVITEWHPSSSMVEALNLCAADVVSPRPNHVFAHLNTGEPPLAIGFMGDDHRPRTVGWDTAYLDALEEMGTGIAYGDDLLQGEQLPTQVAMTTDIVRTLGHMAPAPLRHMYVDNYWLDLGQGADCLRYLPDVVVEHLHPLAGKAEWDEGHRRVNDASVYAADRTAYRRYKVEHLAQDVAAVRGLRHG